MIYDRLNRLPLYRELDANFARAVEYVMSTDLLSLSVGRHEIAGDDVFIVAQDTKTKRIDDAAFEAHRKYVDLQIVTAGAERMDVADLDGLQLSTPFDVEKDCALYHRPSAVQQLIVSAGEFAVFLPHDVHAPLIAIGDIAPVKKVVLKIATW